MTVNAEAYAGSVVLEKTYTVAKYYNDPDGWTQQWERTANDGSGFFNLKNPNSGLFLTMKTENKFTIGIA